MNIVSIKLNCTRDSIYVVSHDSNFVHNYFPNNNTLQLQNVNYKIITCGEDNHYNSEYFKDVQKITFLVTFVKMLPFILSILIYLNYDKISNYLVEKTVSVVNPENFHMAPCIN